MKPSKLLTSASFVLLAFFAFPIARSAADSASEPGVPQSSPSVLSGLAKRVSKITLDNGLRFLLVRRADAPVFAGEVWVRVGGVNETPGITGAAHLLEHMAFKGTDKIGTSDYEKEKVLLEKIEQIMERSSGKPTASDAAEMQSLYTELAPLQNDNEFSRIYQRRGAVGLNAGTAKDYTMYQVELPSTAFELWCWMESERLLHPVFRQFYKEKEVVKEERRMRSDDSPNGKLYEALLAAAFWNHPYRLPTIGWRSDLDSLTMGDTAKLHGIYYRPDNMVIALVGDIDPEKALPLLKKYFGRLQKPKEPLPELRAVEEPQHGERHVVVQFESEPSVLMGYHKPAFPNPDDIYFSLLHSLLASGRSSILHRELVIERQLAMGVGTSEAPGSSYPSLFYVGATPRKGVAVAKLVDEIQAILQRLGKTGFEKDEFEAARKRVKVGLLDGLDSNENIAETLAEAELLWGKWEAEIEMYDLVNSATPEDVRKLIPKYLTVENRTTAELVRKSDLTGSKKQK